MPPPLHKDVLLKWCLYGSSLPVLSKKPCQNKKATRKGGSDSEFWFYKSLVDRRPGPHQAPVLACLDREALASERSDCGLNSRLETMSAAKAQG